MILAGIALAVITVLVGDHTPAECPGRSRGSYNARTSSYATLIVDYRGNVAIALLLTSR